MTRLLARAILILGSGLLALQLGSGLLALQSNSPRYFSMLTLSTTRPGLVITQLVASDAEEQPVSTLVAAWKNEDTEGLPSTTCPPPPGDPEVMEESLVAKHLGESHEEPVAKATRPRLK